LTFETISSISSAFVFATSKTDLYPASKKFLAAAGPTPFILTRSQSEINSRALSNEIDNFWVISFLSFRE